MKLASHNSLSGTGLKNWWLYPIYFMGLCQVKSIKEQFEARARLFDIRINSRTDDILESSHGIFRFKGDVEKELEWLNSKDEEIWIRIILEQNLELPDQDFRDKNFSDKCKYLEEKFTNLKFFGGGRKYDGKILYNFKNIKTPSILGKYSSVTELHPLLPKWIDDLFPFLYAILYNKTNKEEYLNKDDYDFLMIDFI